MTVLLFTVLTLCVLGVLSAVVLYFVAQKFKVLRIEGVKVFVRRTSAVEENKKED